MIKVDAKLNEGQPLRAKFTVTPGEHNRLINRDLADQHPISAISNLSETLETIQNNYSEEARIREQTDIALQTAIDDESSIRSAKDNQLQEDINSEVMRATTAEDALQTAINTEITTRQNIDTNLQTQITTNTNNIGVIQSKIPVQASASNQLVDKSYVDAVDNDLQQQIDTISSSADVTDIVGTYSDLQNYDTTTLTNNDIIKVLKDETQNNATTYYRWVVSGNVGSFSLIGSEGPYYTVSEVDALFNEKQDKVTTTNKLASDLVNDTNQTNKFVTASEKSQITTNANNIVDLQNNKASTSLDNLTADGQKIIDTVDSKISNFMSEVPQNIKLTLENNVVTMKAGSTLLKGGTVYTTYTLTEDKTYTIPNTLEDGRYFLYTNATGTPLVTIQNRFGSGTELPADSSVYDRFFITTSTTFYNWSFAQNAWVESGITYPSAMIDVVNGVASLAKDSNGNDMIFNGMGFVGHHIYIYPNINAYMPAELNPDGSLASTKVNTNALRIIEALSGYGYDSLKRWISLQSNRTVSNWSAYKEVNHDSEADYSIANVRYYARDINLIKMYRSGSVSAVDGVPLVEYYYDGSNITSFSPKQCVRLATVDMLDKVQGQVDTNTSDIANKQDTLVSGTNIKTINSTTVLGNGNFALADQSLSNLDSNGQMIVDSQNGTISNCVLEIPQNIKLELNNNLLTLKAGSIITRTGSTYSTYTITSDITATYSQNGKYYIIATAEGVIYNWFIFNRTGSGSTLPEDDSNYGYFYNTTDKRIYLYGTNGWYVWREPTQCYPLGIIEVTNGVASFAKDSNGNDMIFNGAGFIGHHAFMYPGVKFLRPNGFNAQGKLNSNEVTLNSLLIYEIKSNVNSITLNGISSGSTRQYYEVDNLDTNLQGFQYVKSENIDYFWNGAEYVKCYETKVIDFSVTGTTVTDFTIRKPVRTATVEMLNSALGDKQADLTTVSGYDATATQVLKNINGVLTWVTEE